METEDKINYREEKKMQFQRRGPSAREHSIQKVSSLVRLIGRGQGEKRKVREILIKEKPDVCGEPDSIRTSGRRGNENEKLTLRGHTWSNLPCPTGFFYPCKLRKSWRSMLE